MITVSEFIVFSKNYKLTTPQKLVIARLETGDRFRLHDAINYSRIIWVTGTMQGESVLGLSRVVENLLSKVKESDECVSGLFI